MKKLFIISMFLVSTVYSQEQCKETEEVLESKDVNTPTPESLKGATIVVKQKDGSMKEMSADQFKVVPRKQQFVVTKVKESSSCAKKAAKKNRLALVGGYGPGGNIDKSVNGNKATIETEFRPNIGLQYQRLIGERFSVGAQGLSNRSLELLLGVDF